MTSSENERDHGAGQSARVRGGRSAIAVGLGLVLLGAAFASPELAWSSLASAQQPPTTLRIAIVMPRQSPFDRVFVAWANTLRQQTQGQLLIDIQYSGIGDEAQLAADMRAGRLDGASFTAIGIGEIAREVLVLQAPGVVSGYAAMDRVRTALDADLRAQLEQNGATLIDWTDYGEGRIFSNRPIAQPSDLVGTHPWIPPHDVIFTEVLRSVGATGIPAPLSGVLPALNTGQIDTVVASATAVTALQWHTRLTHVTEQSNAVLIGATLLSRQRFQSLPSDLQNVLMSTGRQAHAQLRTRARAQAQQQYAVLAPRLTVVDATPHEAAWNQMAQRVRTSLVGRVYSQQLLDRAVAAAR